MKKNVKGTPRDYRWTNPQSINTDPSGLVFKIDEYTITSLNRGVYVLGLPGGRMAIFDGDKWFTTDKLEWPWLFMEKCPMNLQPYTLIALEQLTFVRGAMAGVRLQHKLSLGYAENLLRPPYSPALMAVLLDLNEVSQ